MKSTKELLEERAKLATLVTNMRDLNNDKEHKWTSEDEEKWGKINSDYDACNQSLQRSQRADDVEAEQRERQTMPGSDDFDGKNQGRQGGNAKPTSEDRAIALQAWIQNQSGLNPSDEHREAASRTGVNLNSKEFTHCLPNTEQFRHAQAKVRANTSGLIGFRADMDTTSGTGGETIPQGFMRAWEFSQLAFGGVRQVADVMRTETGNPLPWPTTNDTNNVGELIGENTTTAEAGVTTSSVTFNAYKFSSKSVHVSNELVTDSAFNLSSELGRLLSERIARATNQYFTTGTGSSQPQGIVTAAGAGATAANAASIIADDLINLEHGLDPAYRQSGMGAGYMFNDATLKALKLLKDSDGRPLWQSGMTSREPDTIGGYPFVINQDMADIATTAVSVVFGAFNKYKIRDVGDVRLVVSKDLGMLEDETIFVAYFRTDGKLLDAGTDPVVKLTHP